VGVEPRVNAATTAPGADQLAFRFVSGHRALNFLATFADRYRGGIERLRQPADLDRWLRAADLPASVTATGQDLDDARRLREAINRLARAAIQAQPGAAGDLAELNRWARRPRAAPQLDRTFGLHWRDPHPVGGALALIAGEGVELLSGPERELIRECAAAPSCSLLYLDRSRGRRRRWCEMERCGSRAKMAGLRQRQAARELS
jgi:predicted RNA-binding Zn ribbon-like protein